MWGDSGDDYVLLKIRGILDTGCGFGCITFTQFIKELPATPPARKAGVRSSPKTPWAEGIGPVLPLDDFPHFLAVCRRHLPGNTLAHVIDAFDRELSTAMRWCALHRAHQRTGPELRPALLAGRLAFHLRDHRIGPAPDQAHALVRLRATQTALFLNGYLLRWQPHTLGAAPTSRLLTWLTPRTVDKIRANATPEAAAATVLSLHLCTAPLGYSLIQCGHIATDGTIIHLPPSGNPDVFEEHRHLPAPWQAPRNRWIYGYPKAIDVIELQGPEPVRIPAHAAPLIAAHLAYRRSQGASDTDPLFLHPKEPLRRNPEPGLREMALRTCHRIHLSPPWLHRSHCRHGDNPEGADHTPEAGGWLHTRGLDLTPLSNDVRRRL